MPKYSTPIEDLPDEYEDSRLIDELNDIDGEGDDNSQEEYTPKPVKKTKLQKKLLQTPLQKKLMSITIESAIVLALVFLCTNSYFTTFIFDMSAFANYRGLLTGNFIIAFIIAAIFFVIKFFM